MKFGWSCSRIVGHGGSPNNSTLSGFGYLVMQWGAVADALVAEPRQVERLVAAVQQQLAQAATHRRSLHQPMAGKAERDVKIRQPAGPRTENGVVVKAVLVVMTGPGASHLERFEGRYAFRQPRPDRLVEIGIVDLPIEPRRLVVAGVAADVA